MSSLRMRLPPANSLIAFEAAARHLNFTRAAAELNVTQAAVSHQIQSLEAHLGISLFRRQPRGLLLTVEGARLQQAVTMGLEYIATAVEEVTRVRNPRELTVSTSVTFANYWLMSRVSKFRAAHPDVDLRMVASAPIRNLTAEGIDIAVRYGSGKWPRVEAVHLFDNEVFPVCAPSYLQGRTEIERLEDLLDETLIHLVEPDRNWVTWSSWFSALNVAGSPSKRGLEFDNYLVLIQAVLDGQGIALGGGRLAENFLAQGVLVRPTKERMRTEGAFYLLTPNEVPLREPAQKFKDWILAEAQEGKL
ncbi:MAG: transcriptional regulator GcvA [Pseudomonadota bacterium]